MISDAEIEAWFSGEGFCQTGVKTERLITGLIERLRAAERENADLKHFIGMKLVVEPLDKAGVWMKPEEFDRNDIIEQCAKVAKSKATPASADDWRRGYNHACDEVATALLALKSPAGDGGGTV